jgi:hypothetical protein
MSKFAGFKSYIKTVMVRHTFHEVNTINVVVEWLTLLLQEATGSNLSPET